MRLEDHEAGGEQYLYDRQDAAQRRRLQREAATAFNKARDPLAGMRDVIAFVAASYVPTCLGRGIEP